MKIYFVDLLDMAVDGLKETRPDVAVDENVYDIIWASCPLLDGLYDENGGFTKKLWLTDDGGCAIQIVAPSFCLESQFNLIHPVIVTGNADGVTMEFRFKGLYR